ncbi:hypothetical protein EV363DRAFT_1273207 [Boletus edulis]|nr:hypothetical protein EV363DRAFT_1273207 [Boletus edulis]
MDRGSAVWKSKRATWAKGVRHDTYASPLGLVVWVAREVQPASVTLDAGDRWAVVGPLNPSGLTFSWTQVRLRENAPKRNPSCTKFAVENLELPRLRTISLTNQIVIGDDIIKIAYGKFSSHVANCKIAAVVREARKRD